jgi:hypothetical protein
VPILTDVFRIGGLLDWQLALIRPDHRMAAGRRALNREEVESNEQKG